MGLFGRRSIFKGGRLGIYFYEVVGPLVGGLYLSLAGYVSF